MSKGMACPLGSGDTLNWHEHVDATSVPSGTKFCLNLKERESRSYPGASRKISALLL